MSRKLRSLEEAQRENPHWSNQVNYFFILFLSYLNFLVVILINLMICVALRLFCKMYTDRGQP